MKPLDWINELPATFFLQSRLQKVETRKLQLAGTGERLMISICRGVLQYAPTQRSLSLFACPRTKKFTFCRRLFAGMVQCSTTRGDMQSAPTNIKFTDYANSKNL
jgi:hypothetical protein